MPYSLKDKPLVTCREDLALIPEGKVLINTINQHSYNVAQKDEAFAAALRGGDYLIPDGMSIVKVARFLRCKQIPEERIAGRDIFAFEMARLNAKSGKCFFMGSSENVLSLIRQRAAEVYPNIEILTYSPPFKAEFDAEDNRKMVAAINEADPDLLWIGMTAPKQEKWAFAHWDELNIRCHCGTIGAVFDFFARPEHDVPLWWQTHSLEWAYRLGSEPRRMFKRYVIGIPLFMWNIFKDRISS